MVSSPRRSLRIPRLGEQALGPGRVVRVGVDRQRVLHRARDDVAGQPRVSHCSAWLSAARSMARLAASRTLWSRHGEAGFHWSRKSRKKSALLRTAMSLSPGCAARPRRSARSGSTRCPSSPCLSAAARVVSSGRLLKTSRFDAGPCASSLRRPRGPPRSRRDADHAIGAGPDRRLLEAILADLLHVFFRHEPTRRWCRGAVKRDEVRPRLLEAGTGCAARSRTRTSFTLSLKSCALAPR